MERFGWAGIELVLLIPPPGLLVLRMHHEGTDTGDLRCAGGAREGIFQERAAKARSLFGPINSEAGQDHDRYRVTGQSLAGARGCLVPGNRADRQRVVTGDSFAPANHIGLRTAGLLAGKGKSLQELVKIRLTAVERRDVVMGRQFFDGR